MPSLFKEEIMPSLNNSERMRLTLKFYASLHIRSQLH